MFNFGAPSVTSGSGSFLSQPLQQQTQQTVQSQQPNFFTSFGAKPSMASSGMNLPTIAVQPVPFPKDTRFSDLPPEMRSNLEVIERTMRLAAEQSAMLANRSYETTNKLTIDIAKFEEQVAAAEAAEETCKGHVLAAKKTLNLFWRYGESASRMLVASRQVGPDGKVKYVPVFTPTDSTLLEEMILKLESQILELVDAAHSLSKQLENLTNSNHFSIDLLRVTLKHHTDSLLMLAAGVSTIHEDLERLKASYRNFLRKYRSDNRDPFAPRAVSSDGVVATSGEVGKQSVNINQTTALPPPSILTGTVKPAVPRFSGSTQLMTNVPVNEPSQNLPSFQPISNGKRASLPSAPSLLQTPNPFLQTPR